jgi:hypothetical protein
MSCPFLDDITEVVSGCAKGADTYGEMIAEEVSTPIKRFPADWNTHGRKAGHLRNQQMTEYGEALIAVWDGKSTGTRDMINRAKRLGLEVFIHQF